MMMMIGAKAKAKIYFGILLFGFCVFREEIMLWIAMIMQTEKRFTRSDFIASILNRRYKMYSGLLFFFFFSVDELSLSQALLKIL